MDFKVSFVSGRMLIKLQGACDYSLDKKSRDFLLSLLAQMKELPLIFWKLQR